MPRSRKPSRSYVCFRQQRMSPRGYTTLPERFKDRESWLKFYLIDSKQNPILSGKACQALKSTPARQRPQGALRPTPGLENASGAMLGTYSIKIDPTAKPVVRGPWRQPAALLPKVVDKLNEKEKEGNLAKVIQPTDWVNSMVVSSRGEKIRICLDPADLNDSVIREHYPIPSADEIVAKIHDATFVTVLDAKSEYLQLKLDFESSLLTKMNTPTESYRWVLNQPWKCTKEPWMKC